MKSKILSPTLIILVLALFYTSAAIALPDTSSRKGQFFVGSSFFILANLLPDSPSFYQVNYGFRFTDKDSIIIQSISWKYQAPLGIPYGSSFDSPAEPFPGYVKDRGVGIAYHRFLSENTFASISTMPFTQEYFTRKVTRSKLVKNYSLRLDSVFISPYLKTNILLNPLLHSPIGLLTPTYLSLFKTRKTNGQLFLI